MTAVCSPGTPKRRKNQVKRSIVLSLDSGDLLLIAIHRVGRGMVGFLRAEREETAIGYDEALASYQDTPNAPAVRRIE